MTRRNPNHRPLRPVRRRQATGPRAQRACVSCKEKKLKVNPTVPRRFLSLVINVVTDTVSATITRQPVPIVNALGHVSSGETHSPWLPFRWLISGTACLVEDPETKKQRPRNYVAALEERLALQERHVPQDLFDTGGPSPSGPHSSHGSRKCLPAFTSEADDDEDSDLPAKVGFLDVKTTHVEPQYLGPSSAFSFAHVISPSLRGAISQRPSLWQRSPNQNNETVPMPCPFPEYNIAVKLSNAYFENIQPQYPFLHEPTFRVHEEKLLRQSSGIADAMLYPIPLFFINMVSRAPQTSPKATTKVE